MSKNPFLERRKRDKTKHGNKSETRVVKRLGGKPVAGSGCSENNKSDGTLETGKVRLRIESKATLHKQMSVKLDWLTKISKEARETNRDPMLTVNFVDGEGRTVMNGAWCMIPETLLAELLERAGMEIEE